MTYDLVVVGASFAGLACARVAALAGLKVLVLEKKLTVGARLHTTGLVVKDAVDSSAWLREVPSHLVRRIDQVRFYAPNLRHMDLRAPGYYFWATDTPGLLEWMVGSVRAAGAEVRMGVLFKDATRAADGLWQLPLADAEAVLARYLVGADGPHSRVAKALGLSQNREFLFGVEREYARAEIDPGYLHCFLDRKLAPGYIGWAFAGIGTAAQVGLARRVEPGAGRGRIDVDALVAKTAGILRPQEDLRSVRAGMIPCGGLLARVACPGAMLVGDAAGMVSPATAGGIRTALEHGEQVGQAVVDFVAGRTEDPAGWLPRHFPRFRFKRFLRWLFEHTQSDWVFDQLVGTAPLRRTAELVYFHRKGEAES